MKLKSLTFGMLVVGVRLGSINLSAAQTKAIDVNKSSLKIRVFKSGAFSAFAHDHEIQTPIEEGKIDSSSSPSVQLRVDSRKMRVLDPDISAGKRAEIQQTMHSDKVLDVEKFPEISYESTAVTSHGEGRWEVRGNLTLHGKKQPVAVEGSLQDGHDRGSASLNQTAFGMTPISIARGTATVQNEAKEEYGRAP